MELPETQAYRLRELEESLLRPEVRKAPDQLERLLADEFVEIGTSGRKYDKREIISALSEAPLEGEALISGFSARALADGLALVTYRSSCAGRKALRCSIWRYRNKRWQMLFHQGTPAG